MATAFYYDIEQVNIKGITRCRDESYNSICINNSKPFRNMKSILALALLSYASTSLAQQISLPPYIPSKNFTQRLFHDANSTDNRTFNHAYQIDDSNFRPGGPIILFQNPELDIPIAANNFSGIASFPMYSADEIGALRVCLEHRFFGTSYPEGHTGETPEEFESLTLDNVIQDAVEFVKFLRKTVPGAEESKVVVTGGTINSYAMMGQC